VAQKNIVLAFYPLNWESVVPGSWWSTRRSARSSERRGAEVIGISVDSIMNTRGGARDRTVDYPLCCAILAVTER